MTKLLCFLGLTFWGIGGLHAQNNLFLPFGQSKAEVRSFLQSRDYKVSIREVDQMQTLVAIVDSSKQVEYVFDQDQLYAITLIQNYTNRKEANQREQSCLVYMRDAGARDIGNTDVGGITCHTAITSSRVLKLFVREHEKSITLTFASISRNAGYGPRMDKDDLLYERSLLKEHFPGNAARQ